MEKLTPKEEAFLNQVKASSDQIIHEAPLKKMNFKEKLLDSLKLGNRKKVPGRGFMVTGIMTLILGLFAVLAFNLVIVSVMQQVGAIESFSSLAELFKDSEEWKNTFGEINSSWYITVLELNEKRGVYSAIIISAFTLLAATFFVASVARKNPSE